MKRIVIIAFLFIITYGATLAQENKSVTNRLDNKYGFACYHDSHGGWYSVCKGEYGTGKNEGACDLMGKEVVPPVYDDVTYYGNGLFKVELNNKSGLYKNGKEITPCKYDELYESEKFFKVEADGKKGLLNKNGTVFIPCKYDDIDEETHYFEVEADGKKGLLNKNGTVFIPCKYDELKSYQFTDDKSKYVDVEADGKKGLLNKNGTVFIPCKYDKLKSYQFTDDKSKYVDVEIDGKEGLLDKSGKVVLPCEYEKILLYPEAYGEYICVTSNRKEGLMHSDGSVFIPCKYDFVYKEGNYYTTTIYGPDPQDKFKGSKHGLYDLKGKEITPCIYNFISEVGKLPEKGYSIVKKDGYQGALNPEGKEVIPCKYLSVSETYYATTGLFFVSVGTLSSERDKNGYHIKKYDKWGAIDVKGNLIIPIEYENDNKTDTYWVEDDLIHCKKNGKYGFLDYKGNVVIPFIYDYADHFKDGVAQVVKDGVTSIIPHPLKGTKLNIANGGVNTIKVDNNIPDGSQARENTFAFIFANENYAHFKEAGADYAINDGQVFCKYCKKTLGIPETNVKYYEDATYGNMVSAVKRIQDIADAYDGEAGIIVYFSGLGAADSKTRQRYLLPSDASMASLHSTGYSVNTLQETLESLDAPFNNTDRAGKPIDKSRGAAIVPKAANAKGSVIVCTGGKDGETAYAAEKYGHGLLTYALLEKLQSSKGTCSIKELTESATAWVKRETVKSQGKAQTPQTDVPKEMAGKWSNLKF